MLVLVNEGWAFVPITKTGTVSMYETLQSRYAYERLKRSQLMLPEKYKGFKTFTVVRNPYDRMLSWWSSIIAPQGDRYGHKAELNKHGLSQSFEDFLKLWRIKNTHPQSWYVSHNKDTQVLHLETLEEDFNKLPFVKEYIQFHHLNISAKIKTIKELNQAEIDLVNSMFEEDFIKFGYERL